MFLGVAFLVFLAAGIMGVIGATSAIQMIAGILSLVCAACVAYGTLIEPRRIVTYTRPLPLPGHAGLRIALASDIHVGPFKDSRFVRRVVAAINAAQPDLVLLPGDFISDEYSDMRQLAPLQQLRARHGVFAVTGNHDSGHYHDSRYRPFTGEDRSAELAAFLGSMGVKMLRHESVLLDLPSGPLRIAGVDDLSTDNYEPAAAFLRTITDDIPTILLCHEPDIVRIPEARNVDFIVSGHTHGGQLRLPVIGPMLPIPHTVGRHYDQGFFRLGPTTMLFITHGVGETLLRARFGATPEVVVMEGRA